MDIKLSETQILRQCLDLLSYRGVFHWRQNQAAIPLAGGGYRRFSGMKGVSDILGILDDGRFLALEVKSSTGKVSEPQRVFLEAVSERGGVALVIRDVSELEAALSSLLP